MEAVVNTEALGGIIEGESGGYADGMKSGDREATAVERAEGVRNKPNEL